MLVEENPAKLADALAFARERVTLGTVPAWAVVDAVDFNFKGRAGEPLTHLYASNQINGGQNQIFVRTAVRLETMEAVQRQSQWRLQFEPRTQSVTLHWIKIRRGDQEFEHAGLQSLRLLEREQGLEAFVLDGSVTILLVLGDVRPGDVLESCYTVTSRPRLLPEFCMALFRLPPAVPVGRFRFAVRFNESRPMKWKSSGAELDPKKSTEAGETVWDWSAENFRGPKLEPHTPEWHLANPWIQVSDCPDWNTVATAVTRAWPSQNEDPAVAELAESIAAQEPDKLRQIEKALDLIQNEFRYLSVNLDLGGQVPTPPGPVARRRFGDCKDLSFLTVHLLRRLGIPARAVLVNTALRQSLSGLLPTPGLFNHVIVEFQVEGRTRWVDTTMKYQGGDALHRSIPDYGWGLPVDENATELIKPPPESVQSGSYELKESILLDTTGAASVLAVTVTAKGYYADTMRAQFETQGAEKFARERLSSYTQRFQSAQRSGELAHRDDRAPNEFVIAEVFEVNGFLQGDPYPGYCRLAYPGALIAQALPIPEKEDRRNPFALPHPCNIVHQIELHMPALGQINSPRMRVESQFLKFNRTQRSLNGFWSVTLNLSTMAPAVPPNFVRAHREKVEEIWQESLWNMRLLVGYPRPTRRRDFGALPSLPRKPATGFTASRPKAAPVSANPPVPVEAAVLAEAATVHPAPAQNLGVSATLTANTMTASATPLSEPAAPGTKQVAPVPAPARREKAASKGNRSGRVFVGITLAVIVIVLLAAFLLTRH